MTEIFDPPPDTQVAEPATSAPHPIRTPIQLTEAETAAYITFYRDETPRLMAFLLFQGLKRETAADIAQDTMMAAHRSWRVIEHPKAWVRKVAGRQYARRLGSVEDSTDLSDGTPLLPAHHDVPTWEQHDEILRLLAKLPLRQRQVMAWAFDGYRPSEIAKHLQISAESVRSNLLLGRRTLAFLLSTDEQEGTP